MDVSGLGYLSSYVSGLTAAAQSGNDATLLYSTAEVSSMLSAAVDAMIVTASAEAWGSSFSGTSALSIDYSSLVSSTDTTTTDTTSTTTAEGDDPATNVDESTFFDISDLAVDTSGDLTMAGTDVTGTSVDESALFNPFDSTSWWGDGTYSFVYTA